MTVGDDELGELAGALLDRYLDGGDPADLAAARRLYAAAVAADPEDPYLLNNFGNCLRTCYATGGDPADLAEAARVLTRATELVEPDDPGRATVADNRALVHGDRFAATGDPAELDTAVALHRYAVSVTGDDNHLLHLTNLASALMTGTASGAGCVTSMRRSATTAPPCMPPRPGRATHRCGWPTWRRRCWSATTGVGSVGISTPPSRPPSRRCVRGRLLPWTGPGRRRHWPRCCAVATSSTVTRTT